MAGPGGGRRGAALRALGYPQAALADTEHAVKDARLLAPIYAWFAEGFDTIDLKKAKALLDSLAS